MAVGQRGAPQRGVLGGRHLRRTLAAGLAAAGLLAGAPAAAPADPVVSRAGLQDARAFALSRTHETAFCATDGGRPLGLHCDRSYASASMVKAMLLVAGLRRARGRPLTAGERSLLGPMVRRSSNAAALRLHMIVGRAGLDAVGRAAGMTRLGTATTLFSTRITARDQARFFLRIDRLVPSRHRGYARRLLERIVPRQSFGLPRALRPRGWRVLFKGGWRRGLTHQAALVEDPDGGRMALAVMTLGAPSMAYRVKTIEGVARRIVTSSGSPSSGTNGPADR